MLRDSGRTSETCEEEKGGERDKEWPGRKTKEEMEIHGLHVFPSDVSSFQEVAMALVSPEFIKL